MKVTVYGTRLSPFVEKVVRGLQLKRVGFDLVEPRSPTDLRKWNPQTGKMPVVDFDGEKIWDSTFILRRLDQLVPAPPLLSDDPVAAANQRQLEDWADESFLWYWMKYRRMLGADTPLPIKGEGPELPRTKPSSLVRRVGAWLRAGGTWERPITGLQRELGQRLDDLVNFLGARPFFYSERLWMADLGVYGMLFTMRRDSIPGSARLLADRPSLVAFMARVEEATDGAARST